MARPAYVPIKVLAPGFYAREDTRPPVKIAAGCVVATTTIALLLLTPLKHVGIAFATAVSAWMNTISLAWILYRRGHFTPDAALKQRAPRMVLPGAVMSAARWAGTAPRAPWRAARTGARAAGR